MFSRFSADREREFATFFIVTGAVVLGAALGNAAVSATRGAVVPFRYDIPSLPLWYRAFFLVLGQLVATTGHNVTLRVAFVVAAITQVLRVSLIGVSLNFAIVGCC